MRVGAQTRLFAVFGHPVRHSRSPEMQTALFQAHDIDAVYLALEVPPARADRLGDAIRTMGIEGGNLTIPHKHALIPQLDDMERVVALTGACNVVLHREGRLHGFNTDAEGFTRAFEEDFGEVLGGVNVLVLGAGGAARAVAAGVASRGAASVRFLNRTVQAAVEAADRLGQAFSGTAFEAGPLDAQAFAEAAPKADLVVDGTSGAAADRLASFPLDRLPAHAIWSDLNYWMPDPPALVACRARGLRVQDGLGMLAHQGALSFEHFTGIPVAAGRLRAQLRGDAPKA